MTAHQTEHGLKFTSRLEHSLDGSQQENFHGFASVLVLRSTEKVVQDVGYPFRAIPLQTVQVVPDGVVTILVGNNADADSIFFSQEMPYFSIRRRIYFMSVSFSVLPERGQAHRLTMSMRSLNKFSRMASASTWSFCKIVMQFWIVR